MKKTNLPIFPFTAIVGQEEMKLALIIGGNDMRMEKMIEILKDMFERASTSSAHSAIAEKKCNDNVPREVNQKTYDIIENQVIENNEGTRTTPSVVAFTEKG